MDRRKSSTSASSSSPSSFAHTAVVLFSFLIALVGVFPFGTLYAFPILAALTLRLADRRVRIAVCCASVPLAALGPLHALARINGW